MKSLAAGLVSVLAFGIIAGPAPSQSKDPLVDQVKRAIDRGVNHLRIKQQVNGGWESGGLIATSHATGVTSLTTLALLNCGVPADDPVIARALRFIRQKEPDSIYARSLQTMVFAEARKPEDRERIQQNVKAILGARVFVGKEFHGWSYTLRQGQSVSDNSNTQYALLGLWAAEQAGIPVGRDVWLSIRDYYVRTQKQSGAWIYGKDYKDGGDLPSLTMTVAGVCGVLISSDMLNDTREKPLPGGAFANCGVYDENLPVAKGLQSVAKKFKIADGIKTYYHLYGLERAGRLSGHRFFGPFDWYSEGCKYLVENQNADGSWGTDEIRADSFSTPISTPFALLFLSKGRTPVLISKLVHGAYPRRDTDTDWNNDRYDLKNLTTFVSAEVFQKRPLAWQTFDLMNGVQAAGKGRGLADDQEAALVGEMLQSPILYITGHNAPRFTDAEKRLIKRYVENGGFLFSEACCGKAEFDRGIKELVAELWSGSELEYLKSEHPVWTTFFPIVPGGANPYKLMGLNLGCKTVMIHSPQDLSCFWETRHDKNDARSVMAYRIGGNVVAYATGLEPPRPRLTDVAVASNSPDSFATKRGYLSVGQLYHGGDWQPAPRAMRNLMDHLRQKAAVDVSLRVEKVTISDPRVSDFPVLYMHGKNDFMLPKDQLATLRLHLETGGVLLADACCGSDAFDKSFRSFASELLPDGKLEPVPANDDLLLKAIPGVALTDANTRLRTEVKGMFRNTGPQLEGIKLNGRWAVVYSRYDLGCALERRQSPDCRGYDPESALNIGAAVMLYQLRP